MMAHIEERRRHSISIPINKMKIRMAYPLEFATHATNLIVSSFSGTTIHHLFHICTSKIDLPEVINEILR